MIKIPPLVRETMERVEKKGFQIFAVGGCVRDSILELKPFDWDLATSARLEDLLEIFPEAKTVSEKLSVVRIVGEKTESPDQEPLTIDIASFRTEGAYSDHKRPDEITFTDDIVEDLARRDYTITAMADSLKTGFVDPFGGREDLRKKILRTVGDPEIRFKEDPYRMMRGIRMATELNLEIPKDVYKALLHQSGEMAYVSKEKILYEFLRILSSENPGIGLRYLAGAEIMPYIIGQGISHNMSRHELDDFGIYCDNIHNTKPVTMRRAGLFYNIFRGKRLMQAVSVLPYPNDYLVHFQDITDFFEKIYFFKTGVELKRFIAKVGLERYNYLHNLAKAQRIIYDGAEDKIVSRDVLMQYIREAGDPIFVADLAIDGDDLIEAGFPQGTDIGTMLLMLLDAVHLDPRKNNKKALIKLAYAYKKSRLKRTTRKIRWLK